jgi:HEAT repeat protein
LRKIGKPAVEPLIKALGDKNCYVREYSAEALGVIGDTRAAEPLIKKLSDDDWRVRRHAAVALGKIGDARAVEPLIKAFNDEDRDVDSRGHAARALGEFGDARAVEPLIAALSDDGAWGGVVYRYSDAESLGRDAKEALKMLEKRGKLGESAVEPMIKLLTNSNLGARNYAASMLGKMGDRRAVKPLIEVLGSDKLSVIKTAAGALGKLGNERAVEPLIKTFEDENLGVIKVAAKAIVKIKEADIGDEEKKNILKFLKSKDPAMVLMGASMLKGILEK